MARLASALILLLGAAPAWSAITFFGASSQPTDNTAYTTDPLVIAPPASMVADDYIVVYLCARANSITWSAPTNCDGGQSWTFDGVDAGTNRACTFARAKFNGTWTDDGCGSTSPSFDASGTPGAHTAQMFVFRGVDTTTAIDTAKNGAVFSSAALTAGAYTITPGNTTNANALALYCWSSILSQTWTLSGGSGLSQASSPRIRNTGGSTFSISCGWKTVASAGAPGAESNDQTDNGENSNGTWETVALKASVTTTTTSSTTTSSTTTTTIITAGNWVDDMIAVWRLGDSGLVTTGAVNAQGNTAYNLTTIVGSPTRSTAQYVLDGGANASLGVNNGPDLLRRADNALATPSIPFSVGCWARTTSTATDFTTDFVIGSWLYSVGGYYIDWTPNTGRYSFCTHRGDGGGNTTLCAGGTGTAVPVPIPTNSPVWAHLVGEMESTGALRLYFNGASGATNTGTPPIYDANTGDWFSVGGSSAFSRSFIGNVDECFVGSGALTAASVCRICSCGIDGSQCSCSGASYVAPLNDGRRTTACGSCSLTGIGCTDAAPALVSATTTTTGATTSSTAATTTSSTSGTTSSTGTTLAGARNRLLND